MSRADLWNHVRSGLLRHERKGVYCFVDLAVDGLGRFFVAQLAGRKGSNLSVISHESALYLHGLLPFAPARVHIIRPRRLHHTPRGVLVKMHQTRDLPEDAIESVAGLQVTKLARSLIDVLDAGSVHLIGELIWGCVNEGRVQPGELVELAQGRHPSVLKGLKRALGRRVLAGIGDVAKAVGRPC